jgi:hypothetical protein
LRGCRRAVEQRDLVYVFAIASVAPAYMNGVSSNLGERDSTYLFVTNRFVAILIASEPIGGEQNESRNCIVA